MKRTYYEFSKAVWDSIVFGLKKKEQLMATIHLYIYEDFLRLY